MREEAGQAEPSAEEAALKHTLEAEAAKRYLSYQNLLLSGIAALWRGSKLELEGVLREVCDKTMDEVTGEMRKRRAVALGVLGEVYMNAKEKVKQ